MQELCHKSIVLTGGNSGIGAALLKELAKPERYNKLLVADKSVDQIPEMDHVKAIAIDLSQERSIALLLEQAYRSFEKIDLFFSNAGLAYYHGVKSDQWSGLDYLFRVNVLSQLSLFSSLLHRQAEEDFRFVVTASGMSYMGIPGYASYSASKHALLGFASTARFELKEPQTLTMVYPVATRTRFFEQDTGHRAPVPWPSQSAEQVSRAILRGLERGQKDIYPFPGFRLMIWFHQAFGLGWLYQVYCQRVFRRFFGKE
ncbi:SDR family NAD(P)-dependent oxidoreductase [Pseudobacteriovorax antillogorgiicola]|uniref:Short-chain dehydrogenase n=1 Tax=Pseudobacteriovorax antillogorgiicola TaxID=1513793 RepID=A0A1Y6C0Q1_9BACT|nr:SDR family NAD(P)-dependent oxidoreductase [Pseudobacteriovorax antillogorgiicola]TCS52304.1 short-subunit dehydrogenase [Pseudobacteriovorax antillogorgiicola]SMF30373.1 Short-chain dehydrogenase [Pseudobacteriovorax antillogorgiicola]